MALLRVSCKDLSQPGFLFLATDGPRDGGTAGAIVELSFFLEVLTVADLACRNCDLSAGAGAYCRLCAARIMASILQLNLVPSNTSSTNPDPTAHPP